MNKNRIKQNMPNYFSIIRSFAGKNDYIMLKKHQNALI